MDEKQNIAVELTEWFRNKEVTLPDAHAIMSTHIVTMAIFAGRSKQELLDHISELWDKLESSIIEFKAERGK